MGLAKPLPKIDTPALLQGLDACAEGLAYAAEWPSLRAAWLTCPRADWLVWLAERLAVDRRALARAAIACAEQRVPGLAPADANTAPRVRVWACRQWAHGTSPLVPTVRVGDPLFALWIGRDSDPELSAAALAALVISNACAGRVPFTYALRTIEHAATGRAEAEVEVGLRRSLAELVREHVGVEAIEAAALGWQAIHTGRAGKGRE